MDDNYQFKQTPQGEVKEAEEFELAPKKPIVVRIIVWLAAILLSLFLLAALALGTAYGWVATSPLNTTEGRLNMLIVGLDSRNGEVIARTDTIIVASINLDTQPREIALVSVPRDLWVPIPEFGEDKINAAYYYGELNNYSGGGIKLLEKTIEDNFELPIHYYAVLDFVAFKKLIDTVNGVTVEVEEDIFDPYYPAEIGGETTFQINKGTQVLNGETALKYARSRQTTNDFDRAARQQKVITALKEKLAQPEHLLDLDTIQTLKDIYENDIKTDLSLREAGRIGLITKDVEQKNIQQHVLKPGAGGLLTVSNSFGYLLLPSGGDYGVIADFFDRLFK